MKVIELDSETNTNIVFFLLKNIKDSKLLKEKIIKQEIDCCAVKPSLVVDCFQLVVAANKAALSKRLGKLATKCLNTQLLFNLSPSKNISQSLNTFGIGDTDEHIVIVIFQENGENKFEQMKNHFVGDLCDVDQVRELSDIKLIKKTYKVTDKELEVSNLVDSIISRIATKEFGPP